ncbi:transketolase C-terminal domain-containing protein [Lactiplantibacillus paraplantarum]|uniref:transketolase C-terminal domain-containing protein n=1 Tax=Lactiplantibacillus paraplantarum TaxID=60520 RepID=UPI00255CFF32|nr:transketolase C-terminal domain-containing protein [Lactiplantibacillus paraplantarum]
MAVEAANKLAKQGIHAKVVDLVSVKPLDTALLNQIADQVGLVTTIEEHTVYGGLGSAVAETLAIRGDTKIDIVGFPDEPAIAGSQAEVFEHYGIDAQNIATRVINCLDN